MKLVSFLKKIAVICLTNNPYRVKKFLELYAEQTGKAIDNPEKLTTILKYEPGEITHYSGVINSYQKEVIHRLICKTPRFKASGVFKTPDRCLYSVSEAGIIGQIGLVYDDKSRCFVGESAVEWTTDIENSRYANALNLPKKTYLKGITVSYLTLGADGGFYHFIFESMAKTGVYKSILNIADQILFNGPPTEWKKKWIRKASISESKIIWVDNTSHYQCEQLLFTNKIISDQQVSKWCVDTLKEVFNICDKGNQTLAAKNMIWISRKGLQSREIEWEDELLKRFPFFERVDLSVLGVDETIVKLRAATHVIGPHGAGLSNIYLCQQGTKILEIYPNGTFFQPCFQRVSEVCRLNHSIAYLNFENKMDSSSGINALSEILKEFLC